MAIVFLYYHNVLLLDFKEPGVNVHAERYANAIKRLRVSGRNERPGKLTNNTLPHLVQTVQNLLACMKWEIYSKHPWINTKYEKDESLTNVHVSLSPLPLVRGEFSPQIELSTYLIICLPQLKGRPPGITTLHQ